MKLHWQKASEVYLKVAKKVRNFFCHLAARFLKLSLKKQILSVSAVLLGSLIIITSINILVTRHKGDIFSGIEFSASYADKKGELLQVFLTQDEKYRIYRPVEEYPPEFIEALLMQEDKYFYSHIGINLVAIVKAGWNTYIKRSRRMGASTITMQVAKLKYGIYTKNIRGKIKQICRAIFLELCYSKQQILDAYVNLAPCGSNIEGFETASWYYFNKDIRQLNLSENIMLCVLPQNPVKRAPTTTRTPSELIEARKVLFAEWVEKHPEDADKEIFMDMQLSVECAFPNRARHFTEMLKLGTDLPDSTSFLARKNRYSKRTIRTSLDIALQDKCESIFNSYINQNKHFGVNNGGILLLDWKTMEVVANIGSADYYNDEIEGQVNATTAKRSPGSTLKPFIYALALDQGIIHYRTMLKDTPQAFSEYTPDNFESTYKGPVQSWFALCDSRNIPAINLERQIHDYNLYDFMKDSGVSQMKPTGHYGLSIVLGTCEVTMLELAKMYATIPNNGMQYDLNFISGSKKEHGKRLLSPESAFIVRKMLDENTPPYSSKPAELDGIPIAYKTGTSIGFKDSWSVGIFDRYLLIVWIGNFDGQGNNSFLGRKMSAPLLFNMAYSILSDIPKEKLLPKLIAPSGAVQVPVCAVSGALPNENCPTTELSWFIPGTSPIDKCKIHRKINIDKRTGYRTDETPEESSYVTSVVREFWPSDLQQLFEQAGLPRMVPPDYPPEELKMDYKKQGYPPEIISPMTRTDYIFRLKDPSKNKIILCATADADTSELLWFNGASFLGRTKPGETMEWSPSEGVYELTVTDQKGRSDFITVTVKVTGL